MLWYVFDGVEKVGDGDRVGWVFGDPGRDSREIIGVLGLGGEMCIDWDMVGGCCFGCSWVPKGFCVWS